MSVILIRPNSVPELFKIYSESLALGYLSSVLRKNNIEVDIIDGYLENMSFDKLLQKVAKKKYKLVGFTIFNADSLNWIKKVAKFIKKDFPEVHITMGGHLASFDYKHILNEIKEIDSIVRFEGEDILLNLAKAVLNKQDWQEIKGLAFKSNGKIIANELLPLIPKLDDLPFPERDYIPYLIENYRDEYTVYINRGRGCYGKCKFCSVPPFYSSPPGKIFRQRSNENLLNEIEYLVETYHVNNFTLVDDFFIIPSKRGMLDTIALAEDIRRRSLKINFSISERIDNLHEDVVDALISSGLVRIFLGLEAASQDILDKLGKKIDRNIIEKTLNWLCIKNIDIEISFINFLPFNSLRDVKENVIFFSQWGFDTLRSLGNRLEPYPGTFFHHALGKEGNLKRNGFFYDYVINKVDPRVDILYEIIQPSIPYFSLISHRIRSIKNLLWRKRDFINFFVLFYEQLRSLQRAIVYEMRDIYLTLINEIEKQQKVDVNILSNEVFHDIATNTELWLSQLIEIENRIKQEVNYEKGRL